MEAIMRKGILIVIEGADGAGKATQTKMLVSALRGEGFKVEAYDFPRYKSNHFGALIRECLDGKHGDFMSLDPRVASTLYAADRFESKTIIEGWLEGGRVVVIDRYASANMLHQGAKLTNVAERDELMNWLDKTEHGIFGIPRPDVVFYLDIPFDIRAKLVAARNEPDLSEADVLHQMAADDCAKFLIHTFPNWKRIECVNETGGLRAPIHINKEIVDIVRPLIKQ